MNTASRHTSSEKPTQTPEMNQLKPLRGVSMDSAGFFSSWWNDSSTDEEKRVVSCCVSVSEAFSVCVLTSRDTGTRFPLVSAFITIVSQTSTRSKSRAAMERSEETLSACRVVSTVTAFDLQLASNKRIMSAVFFIFQAKRGGFRPPPSEL